MIIIHKLLNIAGGIQSLNEDIVLPDADFGLFFVGAELLLLLPYPFHRFPRAVSSIILPEADVISAILEDGSAVTAPLIILKLAFINYIFIVGSTDAL